MLVILMKSPLGMGWGIENLHEQYPGEGFSALSESILQDFYFHPITRPY